MYTLWCSICSWLFLIRGAAIFMLNKEKICSWTKTTPETKHKLIWSRYSAVSHVTFNVLHKLTSLTTVSKFVKSSHTEYPWSNVHKSPVVSLYDFVLLDLNAVASLDKLKGTKLAGAHVTRLNRWWCALLKKVTEVIFYKWISVLFRFLHPGLTH